MISVQEAERTLAAHSIELPPQQVSLAESVGRVLSQSVVADRDLPPYDRVTMDGIAVRAASGRQWRMAGASLAGQPQQRVTDPESECIQVATGGVLPLGCDAVVRIEDVVMGDDTASVAERVVIKAGQNIHRQGADTTSGSVVLQAGVRVGPPEVATLASVGRERVTVAATPKVAVVSTGDELVEVGAPVQPHPQLQPL